MAKSRDEKKLIKAVTKVVMEVMGESIRAEVAKAVRMAEQKAVPIRPAIVLVSGHPVTPERSADGLSVAGSPFLD